MCIFLDNKYTKYYFKIIDIAQHRIINGYVERHHIIPKSLGGSNDKSNIVNLTAREHFVCHLLLRKMTTGKDRQKMVYAAWILTNKWKKNITNRLYAKLKIELQHISSKRMIGHCMSNETKIKLSRAHIGKKLTDEHKQLISLSHLGEKHHFYGKHHLEESKQKMSQSHKGKKISEETKKKMSLNHSDVQKENHPQNIYRYVLSSGQDYWKDLTTNQRVTVCFKFRRENKDNIYFNRGSLKGISVERILK